MLSATDDDYVQVINKPCAREAEYMHLISWIRHRGSKQQLWLNSHGRTIRKGHFGMQNSA
jgi:hypothetical protein